jgi:transposase
VYVIEDNWNIHTHPDVQATLQQLPLLEVVELPTYASWLNPIEKLWRWVRQAVLHRHRLSDRWDALKQRVASFFDQFKDGSQELLRYVGLLGKGQFAKALKAGYRT